MGVNKSRKLPKKSLFIFCSSTPWYVEGGAYRVDISSRTNKLMTGTFLLCRLSDNCCFYKRLSLGRSKMYVTFDITEKFCT